jgi:L-rhamnose isomerase / sugar isomerase
MNSLPAYDPLSDGLRAKGLDLEAVKNALKAQHIETPSWGYSNSGTRFKTFAWPGAARTLPEKLQDAAFVHKLTGIAGSVALHIPWDKTDDWKALAGYAKSLGITIGAINPNLFQEPEYKLGSVTNPDSAVRRKALDHMLECADICKSTHSPGYSLWLADGTNYAGQDNIVERWRRMEDVLKPVYASLPRYTRFLIEYKFFEPGFYHTDLGDWGMAYAMALKLGERAQVLIDLGHHPLGTNVEHIVALLLSFGKLGGFHFNNKKYADDDLIVGSVNPFELFNIYNELVNAEQAGDNVQQATAKNVMYMIDQSHNIEDKIEAMLVSLNNCQMAYAKALIVDRKALAAKQQAGDVLGAYQVVLDAYETDVRPLLQQVRNEMGLAPDPVAAYHQSGYREKIAATRVSDTAAGAGYGGA